MAIVRCLQELGSAANEQGEYGRAAALLTESLSYSRALGDDWMIAVEQALSECKLLVVVVSPEALESRYTRLAYRYFFNREKPIVPVLYAPVDDMPLELKKHPVITYNSADRKKTFDTLIAEVKRLKG